MKPEFITFTGIDDRTDLARASDLAEKYPIEWGVLFSEKNQDSRYPSKQGVEEILKISGNKSAHICGRLAKLAQIGDVSKIPLEHFNRVQINGFNIICEELYYFNQKYGVYVILQLRKPEELNNNFCYLFDPSGGRGILPQETPVLKSHSHLVGYAGGINPDNVLIYLKRLEGSSQFWIDMETGVRTNGWFDLDKVELVCKKVFD